MSDYSGSDDERSDAGPSLGVNDTENNEIFDNYSSTKENGLKRAFAMAKERLFSLQETSTMENTQTECGMERVGCHNDLYWSNGVGTYVFVKSGARYEGMWEENRKNGEGTMTYPDGSVYTGSWVDNQRHGMRAGLAETLQTILFLVLQYKKIMVQNATVLRLILILTGAGVYSYTNGDSYDGQWAEGKKDGMGVFKESASGVEVGVGKAKHSCSSYLLLFYFGIVIMGRTVVVLCTTSILQTFHTTASNML